MRASATSRTTALASALVPLAAVLALSSCVGPTPPSSVARSASTPPTAAPSVSSSPSVSPSSSASAWVIGFGRIGPVSTEMTVAEAARVLGSSASTKSGSPYCGLVGLTGEIPTGLTGFAPSGGADLGLLSVGDAFGSSRSGLPRVVRTERGIGLGSPLSALRSAYPDELGETGEFGRVAETLSGPDGLVIRFTVEDGRVSNIATGERRLVESSEFCG